MKYSNIAGVAAAVALIAFCFAPWIYIDSLTTTVTGFNTDHTNFGRPGTVHLFFSCCAIIFFLTPKIWAKRTNMFIATLNFAWSVRNYLLITQCELGECPEKKAGIYAIVILSFIMLVMAMLPRMDLSEASPVSE